MSKSTNILMIRMEINKIENNTKQKEKEKNNGMKSGFFEIINKMDKPTMRLIRVKRGHKLPISRMRKVASLEIFIDIKRIIRKY